MHIVHIITIDSGFLPHGGHCDRNVAGEMAYAAFK